MKLLHKTMLLIVGIVCCSLTTVFAQTGNLQGTVTDDEDKPMIGANVIIKDTFTGGSTDINGRFLIRNLPPGEYSVEASLLGYAPVERQVIIRGNQTASLDFILQASAILANQFVIVGTRTYGRTQTETAVPIDVIQAEAITDAPQIELSQILNYAAPSFNANHQTISDGTDHIDPATLRGLGPDQVLVLINGKRRHTSSLINVNGTVGRGTVGTDLSAIPSAAIERIEILRDGAAAQYGSDAIAGVINIVLKEKVSLATISALGGATLEGDGEKMKYDTNFGFGVGDNGYVNVTGEILFRGATDRAGEYTGNVYSDNDSLDAILAADFDRDVMNIGNSQVTAGQFFYNAEFPLRGKAELYSFGGITYRDGKATGFYRFPREEKKVVLSIYPDGFLPEIHSDIVDKAMTIGLKGKHAGWDFDLSTTYGKNTFRFDIQNSNNASMGFVSPTEAAAGGFNFTQSTTNFNLTRPLAVNGLKSLHVATGAEFRIDNYEIVAGEEASYINGGDTTATGEPKLGGIQVFPGFQPTNEINKYRYNAAIYADIESDITDKLLIGLAGRFEHYSDFGENITGKLSLRYKLLPKFAVRGAVSTGFRAPSLHQTYFNNVSTQFVEIDGEIVARQVATFNNVDRVTRSNQSGVGFGIGALKEETSLNISGGIALKPVNNFSLTIDYYNISIYDRIALSSRFKASDDPAYAAILDPIGASQAQFFTNAVDTRTWGVDAVMTFKALLNKHSLLFGLAANYTETKVVSEDNGNPIIHTATIFEGNESALYNREEVSRIEVAQPNTKVNFNITYKLGKFAAILRNVYFGEVQYIHPSDGDPSNWKMNALTGQVESRDQVFSGKLVTDLDLSFALTPSFKLSVGGNNILNVYPDEHAHSSNISSGRFVYSRRVTQFGFNGAFYYGRINVRF